MSVIRILCPEPDSFSEAGLRFAARHAELTATRLDQAGFEAQAPGYDAVLIRFNTRVTAPLLDAAPRLKSVLSPTTGLDHIAMEATRKHGIRVYHLRGQKRFLKQVSATAELTVALLLATLRHLPAAVAATTRGGWDPGPFRGREAAGKVLGLVGCGRLGTKVARVALALGMRVVAFDPFVARLPGGVERAESLDAVLDRCDILSLHVPLMEQTTHLIGRAQIARLKRGAVLINTSRGAVVDSVALLDALRSGHLAAAALDVVENEEAIVRGDPHPLLDHARRHANLLITPHIGGATIESVEKTDLFILNRFFKDQGISYE